MMLVGTRYLVYFETLKHACILIKNVYDVMYPFSETKYHCTYIVHTILTVIGKILKCNCAMQRGGHVLIKIKNAQI